MLEGAAGGGVFGEDLGVAFEAGTFVEPAVKVEEAFSVAGGGVGEGGDDFVAVDGRGCLGGEGEEDELGRGGDLHGES